MYKITIPASLVSILEFGEGATLSELRRAGAERLFVAFPHMLGDDCERQERLRAFSEKILFFEENGIETFAWIPLLGFSGDSEEGLKDLQEYINYMTVSRIRAFFARWMKGLQRLRKI